MSDLLRKIDLLEHEVARLTEERHFVMSTLELAANLLTFDTAAGEQTSLEQILDETACKILSMLSFEAICFYLIDEKDASFSPFYCDPTDYLIKIEQRVDQLIENQTFAWALGRNRAVSIEASDSEPPLLLHTLATASRTHGMFVGIPIDTGDEFESPLPLLTLVLHSCANVIENIEVYQHMRHINQQLKQKVSDLEQP